MDNTAVENISTSYTSLDSIELMSKSNRLTHKRRPSKGMDKKYKKVKRQLGMSYVNAMGKMVPEKEMKFLECTCRFQCGKTFPEERRLSIHKEFWATGSWQVQSNFIISTIFVDVPKRRTCKDGISRKNFTRKYFLENQQVCQKVYVSTLSITHMRVDYCLKQKGQSGLCVSDMRGKVFRNKTSATECDKESPNSILKCQSHCSEIEKLFCYPDLSNIDNCKQTSLEQALVEDDLKSIGIKVKEEDQEFVSYFQEANLDTKSMEELIGSICRREAVWDERHAGHHDTCYITKLWDEIAEENSVEVSFAKEIFKHLSEFFQKELIASCKRINGNSGNTVEEYHSDWCFFKSMFFLRDQILKTNEEEVGIQQEASREKDDANCLNEENSEITRLEGANHDLVNTEEEIDENAHFLKSLLPDIRTLSKQKQCYLRLKIQKLVFDEVYCENMNGYK